MAEIKTITAATVLAKLQEVQIGSIRLADVPIDTELTIVKITSTIVDGKEVIGFELGMNKKRFRVSIFAMAGMRITDATVKDPKWVDNDALRIADNVTPLQDKLEALGETFSDKKYVCIDRVPINNQSAPGEFIYRNDCYNGFGDYRTTTGAARANGIEGDALNAVYQSAGNTLLTTGLIAAKKLDENRIHIPVFVIKD